MSASSAPLMVVDDAALEAVCTEIAGEEYYGIDTEFHTERTYYPKLALIQLAWADKVALVDPLAVDPRPLSRLFSGGGVAVAHAAEQDIEVLETACGAVPPTVFDTQIVAGFLGMSSPSLSRLVDQMLGVSLPKADQLSDWMQRPIPDRQITYAAGDVAHLLELRAVLSARLEKLDRLTWALEECAQMLSIRRRHVAPEELWWKMGDIRKLSGRSRGVAQEVAAWRDRRAAALDRPRRSILSDLALLAISQRPPKNRHELQQTRGVDGRHLAQGGATEILEAIARGWPSPPTKFGFLLTAGKPRHPRPRWRSAPGSCARSPTTSVSTRVFWPLGPTSPTSCVARPAGSMSGGEAPSPAIPYGASSQGRWRQPSRRTAPWSSKRDPSGLSSRSALAPTSSSGAVCTSATCQWPCGRARCGIPRSSGL